MTRAVELVVGDNRLQIREETVRRCIAELDRCGSYQVAPGSIDVALVTSEESGQLHRDFFDDPEPTDVMTFPGDPEDDHAGDIAICPAIAFSSAEREGLPFAEELTLYLVHAWLHLAGLRDHEEEERSRMRAAEAELMDRLRRSRAMLEADWKG